MLGLFSLYSERHQKNGNSHSGGSQSEGLPVELRKDLLSIINDSVVYMKEKIVLIQASWGFIEIKDALDGSNKQIYHQICKAHSIDNLSGNSDFNYAEEIEEIFKKNDSILVSLDILELWCRRILMLAYGYPENGGFKERREKLLSFIEQVNNKIDQSGLEYEFDLETKQIIDSNSPQFRQKVLDNVLSSLSTNSKNKDFDRDYRKAVEAFMSYYEKVLADHGDTSDSMIGKIGKVRDYSDDEKKLASSLLKNKFLNKEDKDLAEIVSKVLVSLLYLREIRGNLKDPRQTNID